MQPGKREPVTLGPLTAARELGTVSRGRGLRSPAAGPSHPPPARSAAPRPCPLATCGAGRIRPFVPRRSPAAARGAPRANTAEGRGSRAAPGPAPPGRGAEA